MLNVERRIFLVVALATTYSAAFLGQSPSQASILVPQYSAHIIAPFESHPQDEPYQSNLNGDVFINDQHEIAFYTFSNSGIHRATFLDNGSIKYSGWLGSINDNDSWPIAMNNIGEVAGESYADTAVGTTEHVFFWSWPTQAVDIGTLYGGETDPHWAVVTAISPTSEMIGETEAADGSTHGYLWTPGATDGMPGNPQMTDLGKFIPMSINTAGQIAGASTDASGNQWAAIYEDGTVTLLPASITVSQPVSINDAGQVTGTRFLWTPNSPNGVTGQLTSEPPSASPSSSGSLQNRRTLLSENGLVAEDTLQSVPGDGSNVYEEHGCAWPTLSLGTSTTQDLGALHANAVTQSTTAGLSESTVQAISSVGDVTGSSVYDDSGDSHAVVYRDALLYDLNSHIDPTTPLAAPLVNTFAINRPGDILAEDNNHNIVLLQPEAPVVLTLPPTASFVWPASVLTDSADTDLVINGSNFSPGCEVLWKNTPMQILSSSETMIRFRVPHIQLFYPAVIPISVMNSDGTRGSSINFTIVYTQPLPTILYTSPSPLVASYKGYAITFGGSSLFTDTAFTLNGQSVAIQSVGPSGSSATVVVPDSLAPYLNGTVNVTAQNPGEAVQHFTIVVQGPQPTITGLSPATTPQFSPSSPMLIGTGFYPGDAVTINGNEGGATYISGTQMQLVMPISLLDTAGNYRVTLTPPGPNTSPVSTTLTITPEPNPAPTISNTNPYLQQVDPAVPVSIQVFGGPFIASTATFDGVSCSVYANSTKSITIEVPASEFAVAHTATISVTNAAPGGGTASISFPVVAPSTNVPQINLITPGTVTAATPISLTIQGVNFVPQSVVYLAGQAVPTTYNSFSQLTATPVIAQIPYSETAPVTVVNPTANGGTSSPYTLSIDERYPIVSTCSPTSVMSGSAGFILTVNGSNFQPGSVVYLGPTTALSTTVVSSSHLTASVPASALTVSGFFQIIVKDVDGTTNQSPAALTIIDPQPRLNDIYPTSLSQKYTEYIVTLNGDGFAPDATVSANGPILCGKLTYVSPTQIKLPIFVSATPPGTYLFTVTQDGLSTGTAPLVIQSALPTLTSISPTAAQVKSLNIQLTVNGTEFNQQSIVEWNGQPLVTQYVSATKLTALLGTYFLTSPQQAQVTVVNPSPGGGTSHAATFNVTAPL